MFEAQPRFIFEPARGKGAQTTSFDKLHSELAATLALKGNPDQFDTRETGGALFSLDSSTFSSLCSELENEGVATTAQRTVESTSLESDELLVSLAAAQQVLFLLGYRAESLCDTDTANNFYYNVIQIICPDLLRQENFCIPFIAASEGIGRIAVQTKDSDMALKSTDTALRIRLQAFDFPRWQEIYGWSAFEAATNSLQIGISHKGDESLGNFWQNCTKLIPAARKAGFEYFVPLMTQMCLAAPNSELKINTLNQLLSHVCLGLFSKAIEIRNQSVNALLDVAEIFSNAGGADQLADFPMQILMNWMQSFPLEKRDKFINGKIMDKCKELKIDPFKWKLGNISGIFAKDC